MEDSNRGTIGLDEMGASSYRVGGKWIQKNSLSFCRIAQ